MADRWRSAFFQLRLRTRTLFCVQVQPIYYALCDIRPLCINPFDKPARLLSPRNKKSRNVFPLSTALKLHSSSLLDRANKKARQEYTRKKQCIYAYKGNGFEKRSVESPPGTAERNGETGARKSLIKTNGILTLLSRSSF